MIKHSLGDHEAAEHEYGEALRIFDQRFGDRHAHTATVKLNLAWLLIDGGRLEEAEPLLREALAVFRTGLPEGHWRIAHAESVWGSWLGASGRAEEAEPLLRTGLERLLETRPERDPVVREARRRLIDFAVPDPHPAARPGERKAREQAPPQGRGRHRPVATSTTE